MGPSTARFLCLPLSPGVCSNSCPLSWWCYLTISFVTPPPSFAFNLSQHQCLFQWFGSASGGQSTRVYLPMLEISYTWDLICVLFWLSSFTQYVFKIDPCCSMQYQLLLFSPYSLTTAACHCPSPSPRACSNSCPLSRWCHPTILSSVVPFSFCLQSSPASGSFPMNWLFASGGSSH